MNNYVVITAEDSVEGVSARDFEKLKEKLEGTGLDAELWDTKGKGKNEKGQLYIFGEEYFDEEAFIENACPEAIGEILKKAKVPHLDFGIAFYGSKACPDSAGGGKFRVYDDGHLAWAELIFPEYPAKKPKKQKVWVLTSSNFEDCEVFLTREAGEEYGRKHFFELKMTRDGKSRTLFLDDNGSIEVILSQRTIQA
jgi:hypothetical protein